jgi:hypothetical protein
MSSPEESAPGPTSVSIPSSLYSPSILESYALVNEKLSIQQHVRRMPICHRAWWLLSTMTAAGMLFAHLVWNLVPNADKQPSAEPLVGQIAWDVGDSDTTELVLPDNVRVVALISYIARSRTSILDCYLRSNLAINDGLLDQVIFTPETGYEEDLDWLYALVQSTPGYFMLAKPHEDIDKDHVSVPFEDTQVSEDSVGIGPFARAWNLALSTSQSEARSPEEEIEDGTILHPTTPSLDPDVSTIYIFIHGETVFFAAEAISQLLKTHLAHPSYAFIQANMINQPVLSWVHHHLGIVRPYRPETELPYRLHRNNTAEKQTTQAKGDNQHPWRASELPLWRDSHRSNSQSDHNGESPEASVEQAQDFPPTEEPNLFNIPIDFHSPFRGHRWLPYSPHEHHPLSQSQPENNSNPLAEHIPPEDISESISTPVTQAMMSLQRPGKWPWTLSALHLYSFLEHLECTPPHSYITALLLNSTDSNRKGKYQPNCTLIGDLDRYNMGLWEYQAEQYGMSFFAIDSGTVNKIGVLPAGVSEVEILGRAGTGAVIDGGSIAVRFVGSSMDDRVSEKRGLETTDLLRRFESVSRDVGGCEVHDVSS